MRSSKNLGLVFFEFLEVILEDIVTNRSAGILTCLFLINYRIGSYLLVAKHRYGAIIWPFYLPPLLFSRLVSLIFGCSIPFSTSIGRRVRFVHGLYGIFISGHATVGDGCTILHHVTIGSNIGVKGKEIAAPNLGDNVFLGVGAKVIGRVDVGENASVGAQALVIRTVPVGAKCYAPPVTVILDDLR